MADFFEVWRTRGGVVDRLKLMLKERDEATEREVIAATDVERVFRGKVVRDDIRWKTENVIRITRCFRGYRGRVRALQAKQEKIERVNLAVFHYHALVIQGIFRGYQSRKYNYNHARRKTYLQAVIDTGENIRSVLGEHEQHLKEYGRSQAEQAYKKELMGVTENLHHLVSTKSIPGVFNSPHMRNAGCVPTIRGVEVDEHLTTSVKDLLRYEKMGRCLT
ncbi:unnamed protein product [Choristocarpus tenellus]